MFNAHPEITSLHLFDEHFCYIVDNALREPERWVALAEGLIDSFETTAHNAFPGPELRVPEAISAKLDEFFLLHIRRRLNARRTLRMYSRLAMVTLPPESLHPRQWICHRDRFNVPADQCAVASVLYLFKDTDLGGTSFFRPRRSAREIDLLVHESDVLSPEDFVHKYAIAPGYIRTSNDWFEKIATVAPRWNRLIFYDGSLFHCSDIPHPEKLSTDPRIGRLTLNGFFVCKRRIS
jgi:Family of unknown function (DUF6445)